MAKFIQLGESHARVDPALSKTGPIRLTVVSASEYQPESGAVIHRGQVVEVYITQDQALELAGALTEGIYHG